MTTDDAPAPPDPDAPAHIRPGVVVAGRYRIDKEIGRGGMGAVWRGTQLGLGRPVAIKIMHARYAQLAETRRRFAREARVAAALRHPGAVEVYDYGEHEGELYLVLEFLLGETLTHFMRRGSGRPKLDEVVNIALQLAETLQAAHAIGLVHRDLKPDNIFLDQQSAGFAVKVVDFGLAFIADQGELGRLTKEGMVSGTPEYIAPEQAMALEVGPPADIYAFGVVLYEMLTGGLPFTGNMGELISAHLYAPVPAMRERVPDVPSALETLTLDMLDKTPEERPSATDVLAALRPYRDGVVYERSSWEAGRSAASPGVKGGTQPLGVAAGGKPARLARALDVDGGVGGRQTRETQQATELQKTHVFITRQVSQEVQTALGARGIIVDAHLGADTEVIFAPGEDVATLKTLLVHERPLIADVDPADVSRGAALLKAGIADALTLPLNASDVARKVQRCARQYRRTQRRSGE